MKVVVLVGGVGGARFLLGLKAGLAAEGLGSCWVGSTLFCPDLVRAELALPPDWRPLGAIAVGHPAQPLQPRPPGVIRMMDWCCDNHRDDHQPECQAAECRCTESPSGECPSTECGGAR